VQRLSRPLRWRVVLLASAAVIGFPTLSLAIGVGDLGDGTTDWTYVDCYNRNGGGGSVGAPINYVHRWSASVAGWSQDYQGGSANHGAITRADSSGTAYFIHGTIWDKWITTDTGNPNGFLGWPVTDEQDGLASWVTGIVCRYTKFEHGTINYHPTGAYHGQAFEVHGAISPLATSSMPPLPHMAAMAG
jgi:hypothetical protein